MLRWRCSTPAGVSFYPGNRSRRFRLHRWRCHRPRPPHTGVLSRAEVSWRTPLGPTFARNADPQPSTGYHETASETGWPAGSGGASTCAASAGTGSTIARRCERRRSPGGPATRGLPQVYRPRRPARRPQSSSLTAWSWSRALLRLLGQEPFSGRPPQRQLIEQPALSPRTSPQ